MSPERKRASTRRSRTGCRTCRRRHVKCDETPIACKNCAAAGWTCDGYDENRLSHPGRGSRATKDITATILKCEPSLSFRHIVAPSLPGSTSDERRGFAYFQYWTVPKMSSFFDSQLWHNLVIPMSHSERAVTHAVVALSALHEDIEARGVPLSRAELTNHRQRFALEQYTRALYLLNTRRHSNDPKLRDVVLTCCILFVLFELLRGLYDDAFVHLQQGLSLLISSKTADTRFQSSLISDSSKYLGKSFSDALMHLHTQSAFWGAELDDPRLVRSRSDNSGDFGSVLEAREELDVIFQPVSRFMTVARDLVCEGGYPYSEVTRQDISRMQADLRIKLAQYLHRLNRFEDRVRHSLDQKSQRAIELMRLHHLMYSVVLDTYIDAEDMAYDYHIDGFKEMIHLSERVTNSFVEQSNHQSPSNINNTKNTRKNNDACSRPTLLLDMGIIPPLLYVCLTCPRVDIRREALRCLKSWPHREGPWDSNLAALMGRLALEVEMEAEYKRLCATTTTKVPSIRHVTYISPPSRIICASVNMRMDDDQKIATLRYNTKECGPGTPVLERRAVIDEASW